MSEEDQSQKTEEPTPKKLADQRKKGNVPSSKEVGTTVSIFSLMVIVVFMLPSAAEEMSRLLFNIIQVAPTVIIGESQQGLKDVGVYTGALVMGVFGAIGGVFLMMMVAAVFGVLVQGETVVSTERIKPKGSNISPLGGLKKILGLDNFIEFIKSIVKVAVVAIIGFFVVKSAVGSIATGVLFVPESIPGYVRGKVGLILVIVASILVPVAVADMVYKRLSWIKKNRMSLKEVRDEHKDSEGDPQLKAKREEKRRELSRQRVTETVPKSTVILTNPTHYAVALKYERGIDPAPICVAKGVDIKAKKIREIAKEHEIPIVENRPLARALYSKVDLNDMIPDEHWQAVAEIVSYVMDLQNNIKRNPPEGSELREDL